jgi:hypothetical protein
MIKIILIIIALIKRQNFNFIKSKVVLYLFDLIDFINLLIINKFVFINLIINLF